MYTFENVKFEDIKNKMIEGILNDIYELLIFHKHLFLNERMRFNGFLQLNTNIISFFTYCQELNTFKQINYKSLTIEDFLYCSIEEIISEYKIQLIHELNSMEEVHKLNRFDVSIVHQSFANFFLKE